MQPNSAEGKSIIPIKNENYQHLLPQIIAITFWKNTTKTILPVTP